MQGSITGVFEGCPSQSRQCEDDHRCGHGATENRARDAVCCYFRVVCGWGVPQTANGWCCEKFDRVFFERGPRPRPCNGCGTTKCTCTLY